MNTIFIFLISFSSFQTPKTIQWQADSICRSINVPFGLVNDIALNESGWRCIRNLAGGSDYGDLQVLESTFRYWESKLKLEGGKTRLNCLIVGIHYLRWQYDRYGNWEKARYAYGRGRWKEPDKWTKLETRFMQKIDFSKYD